MNNNIHNNNNSDIRFPSFIAIHHLCVCTQKKLFHLMKQRPDVPILVQLSSIICAALTLLSSGCNAECGFPVIPSGLQTLGFNKSVSYASGTSFVAVCSTGLMTVSYTVTCEEGEEWNIESQPPGIPYQPCLSSQVQDVPVKSFRAVAESGPVLSDVSVQHDPGSGCYTRTRANDHPRNPMWMIQTRKSIDPCFLLMKIRIESFSRESALALRDIRQLPAPRFTSNQSVNCTFLKYTFTPSSAFLTAVFTCDYQKAALFKSINFPAMMEITKMNSFMIDFGTSNLMRNVSFCGIAMQECDRFSCGVGYPNHVRSITSRQYVLVVTPDEEEAEMTEVNDTSPPNIADGEDVDNTAAVLTLPERVDQRTLKLVYSCLPGHQLVTDSSYDVFGGLVCGPHGTWLSSVPSCRPVEVPSQQVIDDEAVDTCFLCPYLTGLLIIVIVLLSIVIFMCTFNYLWLRQKERQLFLTGRDSLMWIKRDLARAGGNDSSHRLTRNTSVCSKNHSCSYIDIQGSLFDAVPCVTEHNAATYFYLNRYESVSMDHIPHLLLQQKELHHPQLQQLQETDIGLKMGHQTSDPESESDQSDKDSKSKFKY